MNDDEVVMYIIVNSDLKMGKGKIAAQVGHIVMHIMEALVKVDISTNIYERYCLWRGNSYPKIILKGTLNQLYDIKDNYYGTIFVQRDEGRTQIEDGSLTCIGFFPMERWNTPEEIKKLKLL